MWTPEQVAATIDHAVLRPAATAADVQEGCRLAHACRVASICVRPTDVAQARHALTDSPVAVSTVIGFPHGHHRTEVKVLEARLAVADGASELDMVMNVGRFLTGDDDFVQADIEAVTAEAHGRNALVKVILETCYLDPEQIARACRLARSGGADYVKTSTGFGDGPATPGAVAVMVRTVGRAMGVKASGGIRTWQQALGFLDQGCTRLGTGSTQAILEGAP